MKRKLLFLLISASLVTHVSFGQTEPVLASTANFVIFTGGGALSNDGASVINGSVGNLGGSYTGFPIGTTRITDTDVLNQAKLDVEAAYASFDVPGNATCTTLSTPITTQTFTPGVYCIGSAADINGTITLDANGDLDALFIFKIGGALSVADLSSILLTDGASWPNVYWQVDGAFDLGENATFQGNVIATGAIELLGGSTLTGRALSRAGAISLNASTISNVEAPLPVILTSFTAKQGENQTALLNWTTSAETNSDRFEVEHSRNGKIWNKLAVVTAQGKSNEMAPYQFSHTTPSNGQNLYRLKMIDKDATFAYSPIRNASFTIIERTVLYPNPTIDQLTLDVDDIDKVERVQLNDITGKMVYDKLKTSSSTSLTTINLKHLPFGIYMVRVTRTDGTVSFLKVLKQ